MQVHPEIFTHEMRLLSNTKSRLTWLAGLYFYHLDGSQPVIVATRRVFSDEKTFGTTALDPKVRTVSWAGFAEGTYELTDQLFFTGGIRYTKETRKFSQSANGKLLFPFVTSDFDKFTYRVALRYQFTDTANVYASYGTGFKSGVYNTFGTSPVAVKPENLKAGEIGFKADPQSWLRINGAAYYYDYTDMQVNGRNADNSFTLQNAASSEIYGGELEVTAVPVDDLNIRGAVAYNHARYKEFLKGQVYFPQPQGGNIVTDADVSGKNVVRAPEYTLNLGVNYGFDVGSGRGSISTNIFHSGKV
jgi:iron complex outermembrane receptor protein